MRFPNSWQTLFEALKVSPACDLIDHMDNLDLLMSLAQEHSERLGMGVTAISELLEGAVKTDQVDDALAGHICWMLAHMAGLSIQLAAVSRDADRKLTSISTAKKAPPISTYSHPLSPE